MLERHVPSRYSSCSRMRWNAFGQSHAESTSRSSPPILSLLPTSLPSADQTSPRQVDRLGRLAVENGLGHLDDFDQIFGCSFATNFPQLSQEHLPAEGLCGTGGRRDPLGGA